jgi:uncharacterized integral membrane protein
MLPAALTVIVLLAVLLGLLFWNLSLGNRLAELERAYAQEVGPVLDALKKRTGI